MNNLKRKVGQAILASAILFSAPSYAGTISEGVWKLENKGSATLGSDYGFGRYNGSGYDLFNFETNGADVTLRYDSTAGTIDVGGKAFDITGGQLVDFDLTYTGVTSSGDQAFTSYMGVVGSFDGTEVMAKPSNNRSLFIDSLGAAGDITGSSWLATDSGHFGDFHFAGTRIGDLPNGSVPAPGGLAFILIGAIAFMRKKKA